MKKGKTRQVLYVYSNVELCSCNHCCSGKAINITYSEYVFVALSIQHALHMRRIVICCLPGSALFSTLFHKRHEFRKKKTVVEHKIYVFITINQLDELNFIISLFQASTCFKHTCSSSRGQNWVLSQSVHGTATYRCNDTRDCIKQFLPSWRWAHVLETCTGLK